MTNTHFHFVQLNFKILHISVDVNQNCSILFSSSWTSLMKGRLLVIGEQLLAHGTWGKLSNKSSTYISLIQRKVLKRNPIVCS